MEMEDHYFLSCSCDQTLHKKQPKGGGVSSCHIAHHRGGRNGAGEDMTGHTALAVQAGGGQEVGLSYIKPQGLP